MSAQAYIQKDWQKADTLVALQLDSSLGHCNSFS